MGLEIQWNVVLAYAFGLTMLYLVSWLATAPGKWLFRLLLNALLGGVALWLIQLLPWELGVGINLWTALIAGFFGIPGVLALVALGLLL